MSTGESKMKVLLIVLALVASTLAAPQTHPIFNRHKGVQAINADGSRLAGGTPAFYGDFPSKAGLIITGDHDFGHFNDTDTIICGATLISSTKLLTAAFCWNYYHWQGHTMTVVLGTPTLYTGGRRISTNRVEIHQEYNPYTMSNNIAMITIDPVGFNDYIRPARLPTANNTNYLGSIAQAVGYGAEGRYGLITPYQLLHSASVRVISNDVCEEELGFDFDVTNATLCTSGERLRGLCTGDVGSPLLLDDVVIGIGSFFQEQYCDRGQPSGYTRVASYLDWITARL